MYQIAVSFTVAPDHRQDFIDQAIQTGRDALANEPGTLRFDVTVNEDDPNLIYLDEVYASAEAFGAHANGPYFKAFFETASRYADGPTWLIKGDQITQGSAD